MKNNHGYKDEVEIKHVEEKKPTNQEIAMKYGQRAEIIDAEPNGMIDYTEPKEGDIIETDKGVTVVLEEIPIQKKDDEEDIPF